MHNRLTSLWRQKTVSLAHSTTGVASANLIHGMAAAPNQRCAGIPGNMSAMAITSSGTTYQTNPKPPRHIDQFRIGLLAYLYRSWFQRHPANRATPRSVAHNLRMHRASPLGMRGWNRWLLGFQRHAAFRTASRACLCPSGSSGRYKFPTKFSLPICPAFLPTLPMTRPLYGSVAAQQVVAHSPPAQSINTHPDSPETFSSSPDCRNNKFHPGTRTSRQPSGRTTHHPTHRIVNLVPGLCTCVSMMVMMLVHFVSFVYFDQLGKQFPGRAAVYRLSASPAAVFNDSVFPATHIAAAAFNTTISRAVRFAGQYPANNVRALPCIFYEQRFKRFRHRQPEIRRIHAAPVACHRSLPRSLASVPRDRHFTHFPLA